MSVEISRAGSPARLVPIALGVLVALALALLGVVPAARAATADAIAGTVGIPDGAEGTWSQVYARSYNPEGQYWEFVAQVQVSPSGDFVLAGLEAGVDYQLELSTSAPLVGGLYGGNDVALVADESLATTVRAGASGIVLRPEVGVALHGVVRVPPGFDWSLGGLSLTFSELSPSSKASTSYSRYLTIENSNQWELGNVRPGADVAVNVRDFYDRIEGGYHHVNAGGLVNRIEWATPVRPGEALEIFVGPDQGVPRLRAFEAPTVTGTARVGATLTADPGRWTLHGVQTRLEWLRNGTPVPGATGPKYTLTSADVGAKIAVRVTGSRFNFSSFAETSTPTAPVAKPVAARATTAPQVTGTARLGGTLRASTGTWDLSGASFAYQWLRDGKAIVGATQSSYALTTADVGAALAVRVTARIAGRQDGVATSSATKIAKGKPKVTAKVKSVKASKRAKVKVTVKATGLVRPTGTVTVKYGKKSVKVALKASARGKVAVRLPKLRAGTYKVKVTFKPSAASKKLVTKASTKAKTLRMR